jgi:ribosome-binding ATPase YchF (GTP1/OBG family)
VPAENFPFCTIDPNHAVIKIKDERFEYLCKIFSPKKETGPTLHITDIAGLVQGAAEGMGLGNEFLSHIQQVDGIY